jgi:hypothetical protein
MPQAGFTNSSLKQEAYQGLKELSWLLSRKLHRKVSISDALTIAVNTTEKVVEVSPEYLTKDLEVGK